MGSTVTDRLAGVTASLASKAPVRAATTANITLSGEQTIDAVAVVADDRVLVKNQTDGIENGIYDAKSGAWVRSLDFDGTRDVKSGTFVVVASGTAGAGTLWRITTADDITIGTTSIAFAIMTIDSATAFMITLLDDGDAATALATLTAAGLGENNAFTGTNSFSAISTHTAQVRWAKGADIVSAATLIIGTDGNNFDVTGSTGPITAMTVAAGTEFILQFDSTPTLTDSASLDLGGADITAVAGDRMKFVATAANTVNLISIRREGQGLGLTLAAEIATTSDTAKTFVSIPSWVKRLTIMLNGVSTDGTEELLVQIGDSGGIETSGYIGAVAQSTNTTALGAGFLLNIGGAVAGLYTGQLILTLEDTDHTWVASGIIGRSDSAEGHLVAGKKTLDTALTQIRLTSTNTPDTFDAGVINIMYE